MTWISLSEDHGFESDKSYQHGEYTFVTGYHLCDYVEHVVNNYCSNEILKSNTSTGSDQITFTSRCSSSFGLNARRQPIVMQHYQTFKTFDIIDDFGDHHYRNTLGFRGYQVR